MSGLSETFKEAMRLSARMKADGVSKADRLSFLEQSLKHAWPKGREEPWHSNCTACNDTGWVEKICTAQLSCGRPFRYHQKQAADDFTGKGRCTEGHGYVIACFCDRGKQSQGWPDGKREKANEDFSSATKSKPMTRFYNK